MYFLDDLEAALCGHLPEIDELVRSGLVQGVVTDCSQGSRSSCEGPAGLLSYSGRYAPPQSATQGFMPQSTSAARVRRSRTPSRLSGRRTNTRYCPAEEEQEGECALSLRAAGFLCMRGGVSRRTHRAFNFLTQLYPDNGTVRMLVWNGPTKSVRSFQNPGKGFGVRHGCYVFLGEPCFMRICNKLGTRQRTDSSDQRDYAHDGAGTAFYEGDEPSLLRSTTSDLPGLGTIKDLVNPRIPNK
jgi:hypothetical protein